MRQLKLDPQMSKGLNEKVIASEWPGYIAVGCGSAKVLERSIDLHLIDLLRFLHIVPAKEESLVSDYLAAVPLEAGCFYMTRY